MLHAWARRLTTRRGAPSVQQVYYHLGELTEALTYALGAGPLFDVTDTSEFVTTLLGACAERQGAPKASRH